MKMLFRISVISALLFTLAGCDFLGLSNREPGEIPFDLVGVDTAACPMIMSIGKDRWNVDYFGFYLSEPELRIDGRWQRINFKQNKWQTADTALLKFHSLCSNPEDANDKIILDASKELMLLSTNLRFKMSLPFDTNHANPLTQPSPLNDSSMFWSWQNGHKFLRMDVSKVGNEEKKWSYHLGSVGCTSDSAVRAPEKPCAHTNRVEFILPMTQLDKQLDIDVYVSNIVTQIDLNDAPSCMFETPDTKPCDKLIRNLVHRPWLQWQ